MSSHFNQPQLKGYNEANEKKLWKRFTNGDLDAYEQMFRRYYRDLYGYGLKLCSRPEMVRDCIQELFVVIWDRRAFLDDVQSVKAYLLASLRRSILKEIKRQRRYSTNTIEYQQGSNIQFSPEEVMVEDESRLSQKKALYNALAQLPDRQKEVLYLKYFNGMSYDEIEEILSINYQSIRNHIYRAVTKLKKTMGEEFSEVVISLLLVFQWAMRWVSG